MYLSTLFLHLVNRGKFTRVQCLTLLHVHCTIALDGRINKSKKDNSNFKKSKIFVRFQHLFF